LISLTYLIIKLVGDAPIAAARWVFTYDNGVEIALIDRLGVLDFRRKMGYGTKTVEYIIQVRIFFSICFRDCWNIDTKDLFYLKHIYNCVQNISSTMATEAKRIFAIVAYVPNNSSSPAWKIFSKFGFQPAGEPFLHRKEDCVKMILCQNQQ